MNIVKSAKNWQRKGSPKRPNITPRLLLSSVLKNLLSSLLVSSDCSHFSLLWMQRESSRSSFWIFRLVRAKTDLGKNFQPKPLLFSIVSRPVHNLDILIKRNYVFSLSSQWATLTIKILILSQYQLRTNPFFPQKS